MKGASLLRVAIKSPTGGLLRTDSFLGTQPPAVSGKCRDRPAISPEYRISRCAINDVAGFVSGASVKSEKLRRRYISRPKLAYASHLRTRMAPPTVSKRVARAESPCGIQSREGIIGEGLE